MRKPVQSGKGGGWGACDPGGAHIDAHVPPGNERGEDFTEQQNLSEVSTTTLTSIQ